MDAKTIANNLKDNTELILTTFEKVGLKVTNVGYCSIDDRGWMDLLVEVEVASGRDLEDDVIVKANFYDGSGSVIFSDEEEIFCDDFLGFDTIHMVMQEDRLAFDARKVKIYAAKD